MITFSFRLAFPMRRKFLTRSILPRTPRSAVPRFRPSRPRAPASSARSAGRSRFRLHSAHRRARQTTIPAIVLARGAIPAARTRRRPSALALNSSEGPLHVMLPRPQCPAPAGALRFYFWFPRDEGAPGPSHLGTRERTNPIQQTCHPRGAAGPAPAPHAARASALRQMLHPW